MYCFQGKYMLPLELYNLLLYCCSAFQLVGISEILVRMIILPQILIEYFISKSVIHGSQNKVKTTNQTNQETLL